MKSSLAFRFEVQAERLKRRVKVSFSFSFSSKFLMSFSSLNFGDKSSIKALLSLPQFAKNNKHKIIKTIAFIGLFYTRSTRLKLQN